MVHFQEAEFTGMKGRVSLSSSWSSQCLCVTSRSFTNKFLSNSVHKPNWKPIKLVKHFMGISHFKLEKNFPIIVNSL